MAVDNVEIELQIPVEEQEFERVRGRVKAEAGLVKSSRQVDEYLTPPHRNFVEPRFPYEWLRLGARGGKTILNYKHFFPENVEVTTHCDEFECEVSDSASLRRVLAELNFQTLVTVEKERELYAHPGGFEVAFDTVKELGCFIEIEAVKDFGGIEATREKLFAFTRVLGLDPSKTTKRGYPYLLMKKRGLILA